ncbi:MAG: GNAT family N-acetyltransferase [Chloroflexia bacterium]
MSSTARPLTPDDGAALDRLLAGQRPAGVYARSHLRALGIGVGGVAAWGCTGADGELRASLVAHDGIGWPIWETREQADALAECVGALGIDLLSGPPTLVEPLLTRLGSLAGRLDRCPFVRLLPGELCQPPTCALVRRALPTDIESLIDFYLPGFYSLAYLPTREAWRERLSEQLAHRRSYLIEQGGVVVAAAQSSAETPDAAMIGGVATLPAHRKRGLAACCVSALCADLFAEGVAEIGLFYLSANTPAARLYDKLGFRPAGEWWLAPLGGTDEF